MACLQSHLTKLFHRFVFHKNVVLGGLGFSEDDSRHAVIRLAESRRITSEIELSL